MPRGVSRPHRTGFEIGLESYLTPPGVRANILPGSLMCRMCSYRGWRSRLPLSGAAGLRCCATVLESESSFFLRLGLGGYQLLRVTADAKCLSKLKVATNNSPQAQRGTCPHRFSSFQGSEQTRAAPHTGALCTRSCPAPSGRSCAQASRTGPAPQPRSRLLVHQCPHPRLAPARVNPRCHQARDAGSSVEGDLKRQAPSSGTPAETK